jgi:hypothetical protein
VQAHLYLLYLIRLGHYGLAREFWRQFEKEHPPQELARVVNRLQQPFRAAFERPVRPEPDQR